MSCAILFTNQGCDAHNSKSIQSVIVNISAVRFQEVYQRCHGIGSIHDKKEELKISLTHHVHWFSERLI